MSGFSNPLVAANGALVYPQVMSPNFDLANPAGSPTPSWAILKSGLAYFFGLALSGGTITGPDYILDPTGFYFYSGTPALGNPPIAWISTAASDPFGNAIPNPVIGAEGATGIFAALDAGFAQFGASGINAPGQIGLASTAGGDLRITSGKQGPSDTPAEVRVQSSAVTAASPQLDLLGAFLLARIGATVNMGLTATGGTTTDTLNVTSTSTFGAKETITAGGLAVTGGTTTDTLHVTGTSTLNGKETITAGGLAVTGGTTTDTLSVTSTSTLGAKETITAGGLAVTGGTTTDTLHATSTSTLDGAVTVNAKETITAGGLAVTGGTTTDTETVTGQFTATGGTSGTPTLVTTDTWHTITLDAGWSVPAGHAAPQYRLEANGSLALTGGATHASFTSATNLNGSTPLPASLRGVNFQFRPGDASSAGAEYNTSGVFVAEPQSGGSTNLYLDGCFFWPGK